MTRPTPRALALDPIEIAAGFPIGRLPGPTLKAERSRTPRLVLDDVILERLSRPPCIVSFSGGRDSSAVLCLAVHLARRHGLDEPVPVTQRFPNVASTEEGDWQELVIRHLGITHWERLEMGSETGICGPLAAEAIRRIGIAFPANAHLHLPIIAAARGGSLLTGIGGDEVLGTSADRITQRLFGGRARRGDARVIAGEIVPGRARRQALKLTAPLHWLTPGASTDVVRRITLATERSHRMDRALRRWVADRYYAAVSTALPALAHADDVVVSNPFLEPAFLASVAGTMGALGYLDRTAALRELFGDLLPSGLAERLTKAEFTGTLCDDEFHEAVVAWDGHGVDSALVDAERLRHEWSQPNPDGRTLLLARSALVRIV